AAVAANRLTKALNKNGIEAEMLVLNTQDNHAKINHIGSDFRKRIKFLSERFRIYAGNRFHRENLFTVSLADTGFDITRHPAFQKADVIHLHWINQGFLSLKTLRKVLKSGKPVVWTLHDMWPFTGICHYAGNCGRYTAQCHHCPLLHKGGSKDLSFRAFNKKKKLFADSKITFVGCSHWMETMAQKSGLIQGQRFTNIPNAIDTEVFKPMNKSKVREKLNLPKDRKLLLFGAMNINDRRKGIDYLIEACRQMDAANPKLKEEIGIVFLGANSSQFASLFPFACYPMNFVSKEDALAEIYTAVDLFVTPSLQDNLPNTIMEAMACGTPCVGFNVGGIPEMIDHLSNGYVAQYKSAEDLAKGLLYVLNHPDGTLGQNARNKVMSHYAESVVAKRYGAVYGAN
ncbi:MAG: glycosyltransferase family 4 protein, partial [Bacteroides sp.]|nr:glycosyltransferase family 4 protein [Bacteroides sp.]